jgi:hypothetical protein
MSMSVSLDCPFLIVSHTQEKDVRDITIRNGQSRDIDIDIHKKKTLEIVQSCLENLQKLTFPIPDYPISNVFFLCISMSVFVDCPFLIVPSLTSFSDGTIRNGQSRDTDIDIHKKKTLEI